MKQETKNCQNCKQSFTIEPEDFDFYSEIHVPSPTWCPQCRMMRRMVWMGYRMLYKRKCDFTGGEILTFYHPDWPHKIYRQDIWWSDKWDSKSYGRDYDFSRSFFEQFKELLDAVPLPALHTDYSTMINSPYCNAAATLKNCYLCFKTDGTEDSAYTNTTTGLKDAFDVSHSNFLELSHDVVKAEKSFQIFSSQDIEESHHIYFSQDLIGCSYCSGCVGLRNKNYYIFNEPYSKEEFEKKFLELNLGSWKNRTEFQKKAESFMLKFPRKAMHGRKNTDVSGDYIFNSKNVHDSYMVGNGEDARYCQLLKGGPVAKAYDYTQFALNAEWIYDSCWVGINVNNIRFGFWTYNAHHLEYSYGCHGSENLFGCIGIRKGQYCILNKQYTKKEYETLVPKIREQMQNVSFTDSHGREYRYGEYFPSDFCPWAYNESTAQEFLPLTKEEALAQGFRWREPDQKEYGSATVETPDNIKDVQDDILQGILKCADCGRNYQIISMELDFYRKMTIPIPRQCPLCRDRARIKLLNPIKIYNRTCAKCKKAIQTSYAPDRPEIVYCEQCYNAEVA